MEFKNWFFKQFPNLIRTTDSYKDVNGRGVFERYLQTYGDELDEDLYPFITNLLDIIDLLKCDDKFLSHVSSNLGFPPSINTVPATYRKLLIRIIAIYKVKGTQLSYQMLFDIMDLDAIIVEETPKKRISYDDVPIAIYDDEPDAQLYDSECDNCSGYWIAYNSQDDVCEVPNPITVNPAILVALINILPFLEPINAKFKGLVKRIKICTPMTLNLSDTQSIPLGL